MTFVPIGKLVCEFAIFHRFDPDTNPNAESVSQDPNGANSKRAPLANPSGLILTLSRRISWHLILGNLELNLVIVKKREGRDQCLRGLLRGATDHVEEEVDGCWYRAYDVASSCCQCGGGG